MIGDRSGVPDVVAWFMIAITPNSRALIYRAFQFRDAPAPLA
jgi:hypothetical protein